MKKREHITNIIGRYFVDSSLLTLFTSWICRAKKTHLMRGFSVKGS
jgi:hypothetical protein